MVDPGCISNNNTGSCWVPRTFFHNASIKHRYVIRLLRRACADPQMLKWTNWDLTSSCRSLGFGSCWGKAAFTLYGESVTRVRVACRATFFWSADRIDDNPMLIILELPFTVLTYSNAKWRIKTEVWAVELKLKKRSTCIMWMRFNIWAV